MASIDINVAGIIRQLPDNTSPNEAVMAVWEAQGVKFSPEQSEQIKKAVKAHTITTTLSRWHKKK
jgi:hypothetical protein